MQKLLLFILLHYSIKRVLFGSMLTLIDHEQTNLDGN